MLKNISKKTINHKNLGMVSCLFAFDVLLMFSQSHRMLYWVGLHMKSIPTKYGKNRFNTSPHTKGKTS